MTDIRFYHLKTQTLEEALPALVMKAYDNGNKRVIVRMADKNAVASMNTQLWTFRSDAFLPHGSDKDGNTEQQPIYLTDKDENVNKANVLITGNAPADNVGEYDLVCEMFADHENDIVSAARLRWKTYKEAGHELTYWQQTDEGGWEQKA